MKPDDIFLLVMIMVFVVFPAIMTIIYLADDPPDYDDF